MGGSAGAAVLFQACGVPEEEQLVQASLEMPEDLVTGLDNWYATVCRQCDTSEGIVVRVMEGRAKKIEGNVNYPINNGKHSARCEAGLQDLYHPDRISSPLVRVGERGSGKWEEISWTDAVARLTNQLKQLSDSNNQGSMVMMTDPVNAHLGMVVERFTTTFGGRHIPYEPLERTNLRAAIKHVFDQETVPDFDISHTNYLLSFGADFLSTWVSPTRYSTAYGKFRQGDRKRGTLVHVDSRFSVTAANADHWIYITPGMEGVLALSMAQVIISEGLGNKTAAKSLSGQLDIDKYAPKQVADAIGVPANRIEELAKDFANHTPSLAIGGGSASAHTNGLENLAAIYSLNYLVGSVGEEGGIKFNPPPALDGLPLRPTVSSFSEIQSLDSDMRSGKVQLLMVRGADPVYGTPGTSFEDALQNVPFIFSFSGRMDDTTAMADLILPEHNYLEDWGSDVPDAGPGYSFVGFQQPVVRPFFESRGIHLGTKGFADVLLTTSQILKLNLGLDGTNFKEILQSGAKQLFQSKKGAPRTSDFNTFWNTLLQRGGWWDRSATYEGSLPAIPQLPEIAIPPPSITDDFEFHLIPFSSSAITDGRGAHLPWLQATPDPITTATWQTWVEINLKVAQKLDIKEGDVINVESSRGSIEALAYPHPAVAPNVVSIPFGQGHASGGRYSEGRGANVNNVLLSHTDKDTGALAWAATKVRISKTGNWTRLPRFENTAPDLAVDENHHIIELTPTDS